MARTLAEIEKEILMLPETDRAALAKHLLETLDTDLDENAEQAWLQEAERRYELYKNGTMKTVTWRDAVDEARNSLK